MTRVRSGLYECNVMHHRFAPRSHRFAYRIFMLAMDLDELGSVAKGNPLLSINSRNLYSFRESDYLPTAERLHNGDTKGNGTDGTDLKSRVLGYLSERGVEIPGGRIVLVTLPRVAGYMFNPVSFYFCYDQAGKPAAAIAEVTNTFREMKPYFLGTGRASEQTGETTFECRLPKFFYVSPFSDVDVDFDFHIRDLGESLSIRIDDFKGEDRTLTSTLTGRRRPLTAARLAWCTVKYPLITLKIIALIHVHALILHLKRVPFFAKAARAAEQRSLYRPHASIATTPAS
jgi:DUF1365 family protein